MGEPLTWVVCGHEVTPTSADRCFVCLGQKLDKALEEAAQLGREVERLAADHVVVQDQRDAALLQVNAMRKALEFVVGQSLTYVECAQGEEIVRRCREALGGCLDKRKCGYCKTADAQWACPGGSDQIPEHLYHEAHVFCAACDIGRGCAMIGTRI